MPIFWMLYFGLTHFKLCLKYLQEERRMSLLKYQVHDETSQVSYDCLVILFIQLGIRCIKF